MPMNTSSGSISIKDVAQLSGVSVATVSRVINGKGYVSVQAEERVRQAIRESGFIPNMAARSMRTQRMPIIGFVVDNIKNEYYSDLATNLQKLFLERGYFVIICTTNSVKEVEQASIDMLLTQKASGIVLISQDRVDVQIPKAMPLVCIDCQTDLNENSMVAIVESDNRTGGYQATMELIDKGCCHIALFTGPEDAYTSRKRAEGYFAALMEKGIPIDLRYVFHFSGFDYTNGKQLVEQLMKSGIEYDGIFAICDYVVQGSLDALEQNSIKVPEQVKVVGFDDLYMAQCNGKKLTTIHQCSEDVARITVDLLLEMIAGRKPDTSHIVVPTYLVRRKTT